MNCVNIQIPCRTDKEYRNDNKERIAERDRLYREKNKEKNKEKEAERFRLYREKNKEKLAERGKLYREKHKERIKANGSKKYNCECGGKSVSYTHLTLPTTPYV